MPLEEKLGDLVPSEKAPGQPGARRARRFWLGLWRRFPGVLSWWLCAKPALQQGGGEQTQGQGRACLRACVAPLCQAPSVLGPLELRLLAWALPLAPPAYFSRG